MVRSACGWWSSLFPVVVETLTGSILVRKGFIRRMLSRPSSKVLKQNLWRSAACWRAHFGFLLS